MKCQKCNAEWEIANSNSQNQMRFCPFCGADILQENQEIFNKNSIKDYVRSLVLKYSKNMYLPGNEMRFKAALSDLGDGFMKDQKTIRLAIYEKLPALLLASDDKDKDEKLCAMSHCRDVLMADIGLVKDRAVEVVNILAYGLGWDITLGRKITKHDESEMKKKCGNTMSENSCDDSECTDADCSDSAQTEEMAIEAATLNLNNCIEKENDSTVEGDNIQYLGESDSPWKGLALFSLLIIAAICFFYALIPG